MAVPGGRPPDFGHASAPRVYDYLTGGTSWFPPDAAVAAELLAEHPQIGDLARENRRFILKAVRWVGAVQGIRQFLDVGCGLPMTPSVHDAAAAGGEPVSVAYVDRDPVVISCMRAAIRAAGPGLTVVQADASDPAAVLAGGALRDVTDLAVPACVVLGGTLSTMDAGTAAACVKGFADALAPGSAVIISVASYADAGLGERVGRLLGAAEAWRNHSPADVASFFAAGGLRVARGRAGDVRCWPLLPREDGRDAGMLGGVGIRPRAASGTPGRGPAAVQS